MLILAFGLAFTDLYRREGLQRVDDAFVSTLRQRDAALAERLLAARADPSLAPKEEAALLVALAPHLDTFVAELFGIADAMHDLREQHAALAPLNQVKWKFVKRQALLKYTDAAALADFDADAAAGRLQTWLGQAFEELAFARAVLQWQAAEDTEKLDTAMAYSA